MNDSEGEENGKEKRGDNRKRRGNLLQGECYHKDVRLFHLFCFQAYLDSKFIRGFFVLGFLIL